MQHTMDRAGLRRRLAELQNKGRLTRKRSVEGNMMSTVRADGGRAQAGHEERR